MSTATPDKVRVAILISGRGSNMKALVEAARAPNYPAEIVLVVSNRPQAPGLEWAKANDIPAIALDHKIFPSREAFDEQLHSLLVASQVDIVACAGFMRLMTSDLVDCWHNKMINIHPSLLPSFKGLNTHERALEAGVKLSGCTVHIVRPQMDDGPILGQAAVPVFDADTPQTLAERILIAEHKLYPAVLERFAKDKMQTAIDDSNRSTDFNQGKTLFWPPLSTRSA